MDVHALEVRNLSVRFGSVVALDNVDLVVQRGHFLTLLGPSGCGKTTLLRSIAGLVEPSDGTIAIKGRFINDVPIHKRNIGLVFQNYALFPHKTIFDNVAFGLKYRKFDKQAVARKVETALAAVRLEGFGTRMPSQLSGGQQQRVALARALVIEPDLLLLDEPLSALDANLREQMRIELKQIQRRFGIASMLVTHDQEEALALSDEIVVMNNSRVEQVGSPEEIYRRPASTFVAGFVGSSNILDCVVLEKNGRHTVVSIEGGHRLEVDTDEKARKGVSLKLVFKAHDIDLLSMAKAQDMASKQNLMPGVIKSIAYLGGITSYVVQIGAISLRAVLPHNAAELREGESVMVKLPVDRCRLLLAT